MNRQAICFALVVLIAATVVRGQDGDGLAEASKGTDKIEALNAKAALIADQYVKLERLLLRMAEIEMISNPQRAALLKRAVRQSGERRTKKRLEEATRLLEPPGKLKQSVDEQSQALADMKSLLELLLSEERADRLQAEEKRIREYIREVERLIRLQRSAEGRTRGGADAQRLADEQDRIANRTGDLADEIRENEEGGSDNESEPSENKPNEGEPKESKSGESGEEPASPKESGESGGEGEQEPKEGDAAGEPKQGGEPKSGDKPKEGEKPEDGEKPKEGEKPEGDKPKEGDSKEGDPSEKPGQAGEQG